MKLRWPFRGKINECQDIPAIGHYPSGHVPDAYKKLNLTPKSEMDKYVDHERAKLMDRSHRAKELLDMLERMKGRPIQPGDGKVRIVDGDRKGCVGHITAWNGSNGNVETIVVQDSNGDKMRFPISHVEVYSEELEAKFQDHDPEVVEACRKINVAIEDFVGQYGDKALYVTKSGRPCHPKVLGSFKSMKKDIKFGLNHSKGRWECNLYGGTLQIGCRRFHARGVVTALRGFLHQEASQQPMPMGTAYATKDGIKYQGHVISWTAAEGLLAQLEAK